MVVNKCERCGHDIEVEKINQVTDIKCPHCNRKYTIDKKTKRNSYIYVGIIILFLSFSISFISQLLNFSPYFLLIPLVLISLFLQSFVLFMMAKFGKVSYTLNS